MAGIGLGENSHVVLREAVQVSEFIDKIAAAIAGELYGDDGAWRRAALAVLAAMEQPSQKMIDAAHDVPDGCTAEEYWRAMITAELKSD